MSVGTFLQKAKADGVVQQPVSAYFLVRYVISRLDLDPEADRKEEVRKKSAAILRRLDGPILGEERSPEDGESRRPRKEDLALSQYEQAIAMEVIAPEDIPISFEGRPKDGGSD